LPQVYSEMWFFSDYERKASFSGRVVGSIFEPIDNTGITGIVGTDDNIRTTKYVIAICLLHVQYLRPTVINK